MKKLSKLSLKSVSEMTDEEMKLIIGGSGSGNCWVKCDQDNSTPKSVPDCERSSADEACGGSGSVGSNTTCYCLGS